MDNHASLSADPKHSFVTSRWIWFVVAAGLAVWAVVFAFFTVDVTEHVLVMRFGHIVRVIEQPGLYLKFPWDTVQRLDRRLALTQPGPAEFLTRDKKNVVVASFLTWRIADPRRFVEKLGSVAMAETLLSDALTGEMGSVLGKFSWSALVSADASANTHHQVVAETKQGIAPFARDVYGVEVEEVGLLRLSLPEQNREPVFERMKAERDKMAKEFRSVGEMQAKKIVAQADREITHIQSLAYAEAQRLKAEGDAEAARIYAEAFGRNAQFYKFVRTLQAYEKVLDENTTLFLPADAHVFQVLRAKGGAPAPLPSRSEENR